MWTREERDVLCTFIIYIIVISGKKNRQVPRRHTFLAGVRQLNLINYKIICMTVHILQDENVIIHNYYMP